MTFLESLYNNYTNQQLWAHIKTFTGFAREHSKTQWYDAYNRQNNGSISKNVNRFVWLEYVFIIYTLQGFWLVHLLFGMKMN